MVYFQPLVVMKSSIYLATMYDYCNMEHNKDEYATCTFGKNHEPMQKGKVDWGNVRIIMLHKLLVNTMNPCKKKKHEWSKEKKKVSF